MAKHFKSYLSEVKFDPRLWNSLHGRYIVNFRFVFLLIVSIVILGVGSYFAIPRRLNPEIKIAIVTVSTALPGASPKDVESLVTIPIEDKLRGLKGLDTITSSSNESFSSIVMQFLSSVEPEKARADVQSAVDTVTGLPTDAKTPTVKAIDFEDQPLWEFTLTGKTDYASIMRMARRLKKNLEDSPRVDRVLTSGLDAQDIQVALDPTKIRQYAINPLALSQAVARATKSYPAGNIKTGTSVFALSIDPDVTTVDDIRKLRINVDGKTLSLSDIATISEKSQIDQSRTFLASNKNPGEVAVQFFVYKTSSVNIDTAGAAMKKVVEDTMSAEKKPFTITTVRNTADSISKQFSDLLDEFRSTIILVFINLLLFLGLRQASIASLTVPLTFLSSIAVVNALGLSLNFLTLFAFLIALGLLIDDTIVSVAAMTRYYATGKFTPQETGLMVWRDFIVPLWSTTITTIWAFVPLLLSTGIIGEFIKPIPIVVTSTMLSSTTIAVLITIPLMIITLKPHVPTRVKLLLQIAGFITFLACIFFILPKTPIFVISFILSIAILTVILRLRNRVFAWIHQVLTHHKTSSHVLSVAGRVIDNGIVPTERLSRFYMVIIDRILGSSMARRWTIALIVIFAFVSYLLIPLGLVKNEFFPKSDQELIYVTLDLPPGTNSVVTAKESLQILNDLRHTPQTLFTVAETGSSLNSNQNRSNNPASAIFTIHLPPKEQRTVSSIDISNNLRKKFQSYTKGTIAVREVSGGPPAGSDIQLKLLGTDLTVLDKNADLVAAYLKKQNGVTNVEKSVKAGTSKLVFTPDKIKMLDAGLTPDALGLWLRTYASGFTLDKIKIDNDDTDIVFHIASQTLSPEDLGGISIPTQSGAVPLLSLGTLGLESNPTVINREGGKRTISVTASVQAGIPIPEKTKELEKFAASLPLPAGYEWKTGGVNEENQKSVRSIFQAMGLSFLLILVTMVIEFNSYRQAVITLLTIPLAIPGVFYIFALTGTPLSFPALIGVLALFGIVVTNAIVVVEKINDNRKHGMNLHDAIVDASGSRLEPILLTSITSILGLIPITLSDPLWRGLGGAIIAGLLFSGLIKLFFVPVMYYIWYQKDTPHSN